MCTPTIKNRRTKFILSISLKLCSWFVTDNWLRSVYMRVFWGVMHHSFPDRYTNSSRLVHRDGMVGIVPLWLFFNSFYKRISCLIHLSGKTVVILTHQYPSKQSLTDFCWGDYVENNISPSLPSISNGLQCQKEKVGKVASNTSAWADKCSAMTKSELMVLIKAFGLSQHCAQFYMLFGTSIQAVTPIKVHCSRGV